MKLHHGLALIPLLALVACSSAPKKSAPSAGQGSAVAGKPATRGCPDGSPYAPAKEDPSTRGDYTAGGLYKPGVKDSTPTYIPNVACIPEPVVTREPRSAVGNRSPYTVLGKEYRVLDEVDGYVESGTASYYGAKFHGRLTSNREVYDMYAFSAAHKTLPLPSFARVTNLDNGESVIVRVNDRGPFHDGRVIDLSYAAAVRLGITQRGTGRVEVRALTPETAAQTPARAARGTVAARPAPAVDAPAVTTSALASFGEAAVVEALPSMAPAVSAASAAANAAPAGARVLLQVASFSSRDNADRALGQLASAGITGASLSDVVSGGRTLWRLRVPANDAIAAAELAGRIAALGFAQPQLVRE